MGKKIELFPGIFYEKNSHTLRAACKHYTNDLYTPHVLAAYDSGGGRSVCLECLIEKLKDEGILSLTSGVIKTLNIIKR